MNFSSAGGVQVQPSRSRTTGDLSPLGVRWFCGADGAVVAVTDGLGAAGDVDVEVEGSSANPSC
jgi:hypothetical protein